MIALTDELNLRLYGIQVPCGSAEHSDSRPWGRNPPPLGRALLPEFFDELSSVLFANLFFNKHKN